MNTLPCPEPKLSAIIEILDTIDVDFANSPDEPANHLKGKKSMEKHTAIREGERVQYSTDFQRRKRAEARKLRIQVKEMKAQLAQLKSKRQVHVHNASALASAKRQQSTIHWRSLAAVASKQRQIAERTNRELRAIMASKESVRASILRLLITTNAINEMDVNFVYKPQPRVDIPLFQRDVSDAITEELSSKLKGLHDETRTVLPVADTSTVVSYRCQSFPLGNRVEITSSTPMTCSVQETGNLLWNIITTINKNPAGSFGYVNKKTPGPLDMTSVSTLR
ncbi:hypothetical protein PC129_g17502 [Phytophthora cactorum]|uniref:Uncharacterized protein n=2 Tax=Phytophthora cactorum TaxID=29920 RepID=A0A8T1CK90_9STRA|nr:hypothetical protein Pcac1_g7391 [Phytophthora cactorum]KAG2807877.1 hypothetical protein PC111_g16732 [Phytophthora cactorum]KAG2824663.1 hypothetical protein PC112_g10031 [Phytophthora cactorum]KAG2906817.1 hypothetical protein PC114_g11026 [Phytophthora cactorum]KAG2907382.1 hypothetical protein PC117_g20244 [Phytophthora cactorum]